MQYFKVVDNISNGTIDTNKINYSLTLTNRSFYYAFLDFITKSSDLLDLPLDFYFSINNNLAMYGEVYILNFPKPKNGLYSIIDITTNINHQGYEISIRQLAEIINKFISLRMDFFVEGFYLWEFILEKIRANKFIDLPSREKSFFLFETVVDCNHYKKIIAGGQICKVELVREDKTFKGDMNIIDSIPGHFTYKEAAQTFENYWSSKSSENPVYEVLFQGLCKLTS